MRGDVTRAEAARERCRIEAELLGAVALGVYAVAGTADRLVPHAQWGVPADVAHTYRAVALDAPYPMCEAFRSGRPQFFATWSEALDTFPSLVGAPMPAALAAAVVPIVVADSPVGVWFAHFAPPHAFSQGERRLLEGLAARWADDLAHLAGVTHHRLARRGGALEPSRLAEVAFHSSVIPMTISDTGSRYVAVNAAACRLFGRTEAELLGRSFRDITPLEDAAADADATFRLFAGADVVQFRKHYVRPDGSLVPTSVALVPIHDEQGVQVGTLAQVVDLTELAEATTLLSAVLDAAPFGLAVFDAAHRYRMVSRRLAQMNRYPAAAHVGHRIEALVPNDEGRLLAARIDEVVANRAPTAGLFRGHDAEGKAVDSVVTMFPVPSPDGGPPDVGVIVEDVTERTALRASLDEAAAQAEQLARRAQLVRLLDELVDSVTLLRPVLDDDGRVTDFTVEYANSRARDVFGRAIASHVGERFSSLYPAIQSSGFFDIYRGVAETGETFEMVDGSYTEDVDGVPQTMWLDLRAARVDGNVLLAYRDVTERHRQQAVLAEAQRRLQHERRTVALLRELALPARLPTIPGVDLAAAYRPSAGDRAAGDWYDVLTLPDGRFVLVVGDVAGHGVEAAVTMGRLRHALRTHLAADGDPARALTAVDRVLLTICDGESRPLVTLAVVLVDLVAGRLELARAGHVPPLLVDGDGPHWLELTADPPLGTDRHGHAYASAVVPLQPGALLVLYTDGAVERRGIPLDDTLALLPPAVTAGAAEGLEVLPRRLLDLVPGEHDDDACVLLMRVGQVSAAPAG